MTLQNTTSPVFYDGGEAVSTGRRTITLNPEATVFEPPASYIATERKPTKPVNSFMNEDGLQSSCGNTVPTSDVSSSCSMKGRHNEMPNHVVNDLSPNFMTVGQMTDAAASAPLELTEGQMAPVNDVLEVGKTATTSDIAEAVIERQELPKEKVIQLVLEQVPFFFSRENWSSDPYLLSQMDSDQYVPIHVLASCSQFKQITKNHYSIMDALKQSELVQLDVENHRVRPNYKRCIVILREIPESTPPSEIEELFAHEDCPKVVSCEFINNDSWYVTFDNDDDAQKAYRHLREVVKTFKDKPIAARIKTKPLTRQNCFAVLPPQPKQQHHPQQQPSNGNGPAAVPSTVAQPTLPQFMGSQRLYYPAASNGPYNYFQNVSSQVQPTAPAFFYPNPMMQWPATNSNFYSSRVTNTKGNKALKQTRRWDHNERSQGLNSNVCGVRAAAPRINTTSATTFASTNTTQVNLGHIRTDGGFSNQNAFVQNDISSLANQALYSSFSPPVTADIDSERTSDGSPLVSGDFGAAFMPAAPYESAATAAPMMPVAYSASLPGYGGTMLYRNGYGSERPQQRNNVRRRGGGRRDEEVPQNNHGKGGATHRAIVESNSKGSFNPQKTQFNLQSTSFPPLPGSDEVDIENIVQEEPIEVVPSTPWNADTQKFSDVMKGNAKVKAERTVPTVTQPSTPPVTVRTSKPSQSGAAEASSQAFPKPKPATTVVETKPETSNTETATEAKSITQPRVQPPKDQRPQRPEDKRIPRRETYNANAGIGRGKRETGRFGAGNKENRPGPTIRPNNRKEDATEGGWNKVKPARPNLPSEKSTYEDDVQQKSNNTTLKPTRALTNGDISPPPGLPRIDYEASKQKEKPAPKKSDTSDTDVQKEVEVVAQTIATAPQGNSMSWAKMAKSGKDEMEKLSAVIKEKEELERIKKNRSGGRPPVNKPQEKVVLAKEGKTFRRDPKEKPVETKPNDKNPPPSIVKAREFRSKSPKSQ